MRIVCARPYTMGAGKAAREMVHRVFSLYLVLGWLASDCRLLAVHALTCVVTVLHWWTNGGRCFLSEYDYDHGGGYTNSWFRAAGIDLGTNRWVHHAMAHVVVLVPLWLTYRKLQRTCGRRA